MSIETDHNLTEINIQKLSFLLNVDRKLLENKDPLISEITKDLSAWGVDLLYLSRHVVNGFPYLNRNYVTREKSIPEGVQTDEC